MAEPLVTVVVPSFNQGRFLDEALASIFAQRAAVEVFVMDGGSSDNSLDIIKKWEHRLAGWRSHPDGGQAAAINEGIASGRAPFVCWLNSDDWFTPGGLDALVSELQSRPDVPAVYGRCWNIIDTTNKRTPVWVEEFSARRLAVRCIISQPATLIRRASWEAVGGVDPKLHLVMDYDLWWRLFKAAGPFAHIHSFVAVNRDHEATKTRTLRRQHYREAMAVVRRYNGRLPLKWWLFQPYAVWYKTLRG